MLDGGIPGMELLSAALELLDTPGGMAAGCVLCIGISALALGVSAAISLKLYEKREL